MPNKTRFAKKKEKFFIKLLKIVKRSLKKVPVMAWATFALIGAFLVGLMLGIGFIENATPPTSPYQLEAAKNNKYLELISGYEDLSKLYSDQGDNLAIILDRDMLENHRDEVNAAILSVEQYRDMLLMQRGRIAELRKFAELPPEDLKQQQPKIN